MQFAKVNLKQVDFESGTGILTIIRTLKNNGSPAPVFDTDESNRSFFVIDMGIQPEEQKERLVEGLVEGLVEKVVVILQEVGRLIFIKKIDYEIHRSTTGTGLY